MADTLPIPVRLNNELIERLDRVATAIGSNRAAVIRFCVQTFVEHVEKHGRASLPPNWEELLAKADSRTTESRHAITRYQANPTLNRLRIISPSSGAVEQAEASAPAAMKLALHQGPKSPPSPKAGAPTSYKRKPGRGTGASSTKRPESPTKAPK